MASQQSTGCHKVMVEEKSFIEKILCLHQRGVVKVLTVEGKSVAQSSAKYKYRAKNKYFKFSESIPKV